MAKSKANCRGGDGCGLDQASAEHATISLAVDLRRSAERTIKQQALTMMPAVVAGIEPMWLSPSRGFVPAVDGADVLIRAARDPSRTKTIWARSDRSPDASPKVLPAKTALQHFHGAVRSDVLLALWAGQKEGLPTAAGTLKEILTDAAKQVETRYGVRVLLACLHPPSPHLEKVLSKMGYKQGSISDADDKVGQWNLHPQIYVALVEDYRWLAKKKGKLPRTYDATVNGCHLLDLGVDVEAHAYSAKAGRRRREHELYLSSGGKEGRKLPADLVAALAAGTISASGAIEEAVRRELTRWREAWKKSKEKGRSATLVDKLKKDKAKLIQADAPGYWASQFVTQELISRLPIVHPRYGELLDECRTAFVEIKRRQIAGEHREGLNDLVNAWWRERTGAAAKKKDAERDQENVALSAQLNHARGRVAELEEVVRDTKLQLAALDEDRARAATVAANYAKIRSALAEAERKLAENESAFERERSKAWLALQKERMQTTKLIQNIEAKGQMAEELTGVTLSLLNRFVEEAAVQVRALAFSYDQSRSLKTPVLLGADTASGYIISPSLERLWGRVSEKLPAYGDLMNALDELGQSRTLRHDLDTHQSALERG